MTERRFPVASPTPQEKPPLRLTERGERVVRGAKRLTSAALAATVVYTGYAGVAIADRGLECNEGGITESFPLGRENNPTAAIGRMRQLHGGLPKVSDEQIYHEIREGTPPKELAKMQTPEDDGGAVLNLPSGKCEVQDADFVPGA